MEKSRIVLWMDDDYIINKYVIPCIEEKCDCFIIPFDNAQDVMDFIKSSSKYDLAIIDRMNLLGVDGDEAINLSKKINPNIPVIAISAWNSKPISANVSYEKSRGTEELLKLINDFLS